jgi:hypothetical protein
MPRRGGSAARGWPADRIPMNRTTLIDHSDAIFDRLVISTEFRKR